MNRAVRLFVVLGLLLSVAGCYHATIDTELEPSAKTYDIPWASSWVFGLVPPKAIKTTEECPDGVAMVETELSFVNQLVGFLTLGIYTPMHIKVTCAAGGSASADGATSVEVGADATLEEKQQALTEAARLSKESGGSVFFVLKE
jgi:hypothetical protein